MEIAFKNEADESPAAAELGLAAPSILKLPLPPRHTPARREIVVPGRAPSEKHHLDEALIVALARARLWLRGLTQGEYPDTAEIARRFGLNEAHVRRLLRFAFLAPDIVEAIIEGRQHRSLTVKRLLRGISLAWDGQRQPFGGT